MLYILHFLSTFKFLSNGAVDEEVDRSIEDEEEVVETHDTEIPGGFHQLGLTPDISRI